MLIIKKRSSKKISKKFLIRFVLLSAFMGGILLHCSFQSSNRAVETQASAEAQCRAFLEACGWMLTDRPASVSEAVIPLIFDKVYDAYNRLQLAQGYDLSAYKGKQIERYAFSLAQYNGKEAAGEIVATVLWFNGRIIGGDICSVASDGFMHGFHSEVVL